MTQDPDVVVRTVHRQAAAHECELVLLSQGLSPRLVSTGDAILITVPADHAGRARAALTAYDGEVSAVSRKVEPASPKPDLRAGIIAALLLLCFFLVTVFVETVPWLQRGSANAAKIFDGQLWRSITALTLHADGAHALSNACALGIFFAALAGQLGSGAAAFLVLLAGAAGNLANAYIQGPPHEAVGASTAIFAAVGILGVLALVHRRRAGETSARAWAAMAASLALLGMLGSNGARVDVMAHLLGFLAGAVSGTLTLRFPSPAGFNTQRLSGAVTGVWIAGSWLLALWVE